MALSTSEVDKEVSPEDRCPAEKCLCLVVYIRPRVYYPEAPFMDRLVKQEVNRENCVTSTLITPETKVQSHKHTFTVRFKCATRCVL